MLQIDYFMQKIPKKTGYSFVQNRVLFCAKNNNYLKISKLKNVEYRYMYSTFFEKNPITLNLGRIYAKTLLKFSGK